MHGVDYSGGFITYIPTREGWLYLAVVLSLRIRQVLGCGLVERMPIFTLGESNSMFSMADIKRASSRLCSPSMTRSYSSMTEQHVLGFAARGDTRGRFSWRPWRVRRFDSARGRTDRKSVV